MVHVHEINSLDELDGYRLAWKNLHAQTRAATFFQSLDWLVPYWRHYGEGQRLRVLVVEGSEGMLGILPLVVRTESTRVGRLRVLTYPLHDWGSFYAPIGPHPTATLIAGLGHIRRTRRDWDLLDLRWVHRYGTDHGRTQHVLLGLGFQAYEQAWDTASTVELSGDFNGYWSSRDTHWRKNIDRSERKLTERAHVEYVRYRPAGASQGEADPGWEFYDRCEQLAAASWQGASTTGTTLSHTAVREYLRDAHAAACVAGGADLNLLVVDGEPAAFAYCYHFQGYVFGLRMGYDAAVARDGAGHVLLKRMLADSFRRGDHTFDLGPGALANKRHWRTSLATSYRYTHFAGVPRAQALRVGRLARDVLRAGKAPPADCRA
jgi:CelD/BcsL family acetyltransferase involved in cellulose biosynthesis